MSEIWKDIFGYEGYYQISNTGKVRSLPRTQADKDGRMKSYQGKTLKGKPNSRGYRRVDLKAYGRCETVFVHRLVALHFISNPQPEKYTIVNHIDSNPKNNNATNLEWTDACGNMQHALKKGRLNRTQEWLSKQRKSLAKYDKPVVGYDPLTGKTYVEFSSIQEAGRNGYDASCVCWCCKGIRKTHKGLAWMYADRGAI